MRCPWCGIEHPLGARFCSHCGKPLAKGRPGSVVKPTGRGRTVWTIAIAALALLLVLWWFLEGPGRGKEGVSPVPPASRTGARIAAGAKQDDPPMPSSHETRRRDSRSISMEWPAGEVSIDHHLGLNLAVIPGVVLSGSWIALPVEACYGGDTWRFLAEDGRSAPITTGAWRDGDSVALWRLEEGTVLPGPELAPWQPGVPLSWRPVSGGRLQEVAGFSIEEGSARFVRVRPGTTPQESGLFMQDGRVVGWTFEKRLDAGFLWTGPPGEELTGEIRVDHFYHLTFANGREERFIQGLALGEKTPPAVRLKTFVDGFRLPPELDPDRTPRMLRRESVAEHMRALAEELMSMERPGEAAGLLSRETLVAAGDERLVIQSLKAAARYYGLGSAVDLAEDVLEDLNPVRGPATVELMAHVRGLYLEWIRERLEQGDSQGAWRAYKRSEGPFPGDPEIRLLAVEIGLKDRDWRSAERFLPEGGIRPELAEWAARLKDRVDRLRSEEGKIVIRFQAGLRHIPVRALLNGSVEQEFVIDTGASQVTIPSSTADALGLDMENTPRRWVSTAGGAALAREVTLDAVALKGREIKGVQAWVLDIPGRPDLGLLGLSYLNRFQVEIDNDRGVLMLKPR